MPGPLIQAEDREAAGEIFAIGNVRLFLRTLQSVLGRKESNNLDAGSEHQVDIALPIPAKTGVVGDQSDALPTKRREIGLGQDIQTSEHVAFRLHYAAQSWPENGLVIAGERDSGSFDSERRRGNRSYAAAERTERFSAMRMNDIGEQDNVAAADGIHPHRRAGKAGMTEGADRKQVAPVAGIRRVDVPAEPAQNWLVGGRFR